MTEALRGVATRFARQDYVEESWRIVEPILDHPSKPLPYAKGSWGPQAAVDLPEGGWRLGT